MGLEEYETTMYYYTCDNCESSSESAESEEEAKHDAIFYGWKFNKKLCLCDECVEEKLEEDS